MEDTGDFTGDLKKNKTICTRKPWGIYRKLHRLSDMRKNSRIFAAHLV